MIYIILLSLALIVASARLTLQRQWASGRVAEVFLSYLLFFSLGVMGLFAAYGHIFMGPEIAASIGWQAGSPFQYEMGIANLAFGVLGILSYWIRGHFWTATVIGWFVLFVGCFIGHVINYYTTGNTAPYNIGPSIWLSDLIVPVAALVLLRRYLHKTVKA